MHPGHKRANSFSSCAGTGNPEVLQQQDVIRPILLPPPPPAILERSRLNTLPSIPSRPASNFNRKTEERRSFTGHSSLLSPSLETALNSRRPYKGVAISRATPAAIRFSVTPDIEDWLIDMSRPRSPSKNWKNGVADAGVPALDQALAAIKDQLAMLKSERVAISSRVDTFTTEINKTQEHCKAMKRQRSQASMAQAGSPGRALRRIKSLESRAQSCTQLNKLHSLDSATDQDEESFFSQSQGSDSSHNLNSPVTKRKRKTSVPNSIMNSISNNIFQFSPPTNKKTQGSSGLPPVPIRRVSSNNSANRRSLQALETIRDRSPSLDEDMGVSPITPNRSPKLVRVQSVHSISSKPHPRPLVAPCPSRSSSQTLYNKNGFSTLPGRKSSSNSSNVLDDSSSDSCSIPDAIWDVDQSSIKSECSVFRISSATGQVEKVSPYVKTQIGKQYSSSFSIDSALDNGNTITKRHHVHHQLSTSKTCYSIEDTDNLNMTFNEEPRPLSACFESPQQSPSYVQPVKRSSILLPSIETTV